MGKRNTVTPKRVGFGVSLPCSLDGGTAWTIRHFGSSFRSGVGAAKAARLAYMALHPEEEMSCWSEIAERDTRADVVPSR